MSFNNKVRLPEGKLESGIKEEEEQNSNLSWKLEKRDMESGKDLTASLVQTKPITPKAFFLQDLKQEEEKVENDFLIAITDLHGKNKIITHGFDEEIDLLNDQISKCQKDIDEKKSHLHIQNDFFGDNSHEMAYVIQACKDAKTLEDNITKVIDVSKKITNDLVKDIKAIYNKIVMVQEHFKKASKEIQIELEELGNVDNARGTYLQKQLKDEFEELKVNYEEEIRKCNVEKIAKENLLGEISTLMKEVTDEYSISTKKGFVNEKLIALGKKLKFPMVDEKMTEDLDAMICSSKKLSEMKKERTQRLQNFHETKNSLKEEESQLYSKSTCSLKEIYLEHTRNLFSNIKQAREEADVTKQSYLLNHLEEAVDELLNDSQNKFLTERKNALFQDKLKQENLDAKQHLITAAQSAILTCEQKLEGTKFKRKTAKNLKTIDEIKKDLESKLVALSTLKSEEIELEKQIGNSIHLMKLRNAQWKCQKEILLKAKKQMMNKSVQFHPEENYKVKKEFKKEIKQAREERLKTTIHMSTPIFSAKDVGNKHGHTDSSEQHKCSGENMFHEHNPKLAQEGILEFDDSQDKATKITTQNRQPDTVYHDCPEEMFEANLNENNYPRSPESNMELSYSGLEQQEDKLKETGWLPAKKNDDPDSCQVIDSPRSNKVIAKPSKLQSEKHSDDSLEDFTDIHSKLDEVLMKLKKPKTKLRNKWNEPALTKIKKIVKRNEEVIYELGIDKEGKHFSEIGKKNVMTDGSIYFYKGNQLSQVRNADNGSWHRGGNKKRKILNLHVQVHSYYNKDKDITKTGLYFERDNFTIIHYQKSTFRSKKRTTLIKRKEIKYSPNKSVMDTSSTSISTTVSSVTDITPTKKTCSVLSRNYTVAKPHDNINSVVTNRQIKEILKEAGDSKTYVIPSTTVIYEPKAGDIYCFKLDYNNFEQELKSISSDGFTWRKKNAPNELHFAQKLGSLNRYTYHYRCRNSSTNKSFKKYIYTNKKCTMAAVHYVGNEKLAVQDRPLKTKQTRLHPIQKARIEAAMEEGSKGANKIYQKLKTTHMSKGIAKSKVDASIEQIKYVQKMHRKNEKLPGHDIVNVKFLSDHLDENYIRYTTIVPSVQITVSNPNSIEEFKNVLKTIDPDTPLVMHADTTFEHHNRYITTLSYRHPLMQRVHPDKSTRNPEPIVPLVSLIHETRSDDDIRTFFYNAGKILKSNEIAMQKKVLVTDEEFSGRCEWPNTTQLLCWNHQRYNIHMKADSYGMSKEHIALVNEDCLRFLRHSSAENYIADKHETFQNAEHWNTNKGEKLKNYFDKNKHHKFLEIGRWKLEELGLPNPQVGITNNPAETLNSQLAQFKGQRGKEEKSSHEIILDLHHFEKSIDNQIKSAYFNEGPFQLKHSYSHLRKALIDLPSTFTEEPRMIVKNLKSQSEVKGSQLTESPPDQCNDEIYSAKESLAKYIVEENCYSLSTIKLGDTTHSVVSIKHNHGNYMCDITDRTCNCGERDCHHMIASLYVTNHINDFKMPTKESIKREKISFSTLKVPGRRAKHGTKKPTKLDLDSAALKSIPWKPKSGLKRATVRLTSTPKRLKNVDSIEKSEKPRNLFIGQNTSGDFAMEVEIFNDTLELDRKTFGKKALLTTNSRSVTTSYDMDIDGQARFSNIATEMEKTNLFPTRIKKLASEMHVDQQHFQTPNHDMQLMTEATEIISIKPQISREEKVVHVTQQEALTKNDWTMKVGDLKKETFHETEVVFAMVDNGTVVAFTNDIRLQKRSNYIQVKKQALDYAARNAVFDNSTKSHYVKFATAYCKENLEEAAKATISNKVTFKNLQKFEIYCKCGKVCDRQLKDNVRECVDCRKTFHSNCIEHNKCSPCTSQFKGIEWGSSNFTNTCPVDNIMTVVGDHTQNIDKDFINDHFLTKVNTNLFEKQFGKSVQLALDGQGSLGQENYCKLLAENKIGGVTKPRHEQGQVTKGNCWGGMTDLTYDNMNVSAFKVGSKCSKEECKKPIREEIKRQFYLNSVNPTSEKELTISESIEQHINGHMNFCFYGCPLGTLRKSEEVKTPNLRNPPAIINFGNFAAKFTTKTIIEEAPEKLLVDGRIYTKKMISLYDDGHFTSVFRRNDEWLHYDGRGNLPEATAGDKPLIKYAAPYINDQSKRADNFSYFIEAETS